MRILPINSMISVNVEMMKTRRIFVLAVALILLGFSHTGSSATPGTKQATKAAFTLYQLPTHGPGMSYVLVSEGGRVVVVDGGSGGYWDGVENDGPFLRSFLEARGGHVDAWFVSHPHDDHVSGLIEVLRRYKEGLWKVHNRGASGDRGSVLFLRQPVAPSALAI